MREDVLFNGKSAKAFISNSPFFAPNPRTKIMPTGGVNITEESIKSWFEAGIVAAGIGSKLITKESVASKDWDNITKNVANTLKIIQKFKK